MKSELGPPATLVSSAAAGVRMIVWCKACSHQVEPDPTEQSERYGAETTLADWHARLSCSKCGSRQLDMVVTGSPRRRLRESTSFSQCIACEQMSVDPIVFARADEVIE